MAGSMWKAASRAALIAAVCFLGVAPAFADVRILSSSGGQVAGYLDFFEKINRSGERVVIDGPCLSACTLVLSSIPRKRVCVTKRAVLGFHAPLVVDNNGRASRSREITRAMTATYPKSVQAWIKRNGGLKRNFIYLQGRELTKLYPRC